MNVMRFDVEIKDIKKVNPLFSKCKIRVLYAGINRNSSYFSKETIERCLPTIFNIPIVGEYIKDRDNFGDHGGSYEIKDGKIKYIHTTKPYGVIPESANVYWEQVEENDGKINEYLVVDGAYLWTGRYPETELLIGRKFGLSMEIEINKGKFQYIDGQNVYVVEDFIFSALCILGISKESDPNGHVEPCFESASIIAYTINKEEFMSQFKQMIEELKFSLGQMLNGSVQDGNKGGSRVDELKDLLDKYSITLEQLQEKGINYEEYTFEELEEKIKQVFQQEINDDKSDVDQKDTQKNENEEVQDEQTNFSLTVNQLKEEISRTIYEFEIITDEYLGFSYPRYDLIDIDTETQTVIAFDHVNWYLVGFAYVLNGDKVVVDRNSEKRYKVEYRPMELNEEQNTFGMIKDRFEQAKNKHSEIVSQLENQISLQKTELETLKEQYSSLESQFKEINEKYQNKIKEEREAAEEQLFSQFANELTEDEINAVKANKDKMSLDEIEKELFALLGKKKAKFSKQMEKHQRVIDLEVESKKDKKLEKSYDVFFQDDK